MSKDSARTETAAPATSEAPVSTGCKCLTICPDGAALVDLGTSQYGFWRTSRFADLAADCLKSSGDILVVDLDLEGFDPTTALNGSNLAGMLAPCTGKLVIHGYSRPPAPEHFCRRLLHNQAISTEIHVLGSTYFDNQVSGQPSLNRRANGLEAALTALTGQVIGLPHYPDVAADLAAAAGMLAGFDRIGLANINTGRSRHQISLTTAPSTPPSDPDRDRR